MKYFCSILFQKSLFFCSLLFILSYTSIAQNNQYLNLNVNNGLPSNHVYGTIVDKYGYLWIATSQGVTRYNGYELKTFNLSDGLPNEDIWQLLEDRRGRIWLGNISDEIGYIYNNRYHKSFIKNILGLIYPVYMQRFGNGIIFGSHYISGTQQITLCTSTGDSFNTYILKESLFAEEDQEKEKSITGKKLVNIISINKLGKVIIIYGERLYTIDLNNKKFLPKGSLN